MNLLIFNPKKEWGFQCRNPTLKECEDDTHTLEMGTWESSRVPENSKFDYKGQNTYPWGVLYIVGKVLKCRCQKWRMCHLDICNISYGRKKGRESNWQFNFRPLKVGNWPDPDVCKWSVTHHWKILKESYKFALDFILIGGLSKELWTLSQPHFGQLWGWNSHSQSWGLGILRVSRIFRVRQQGPKHLVLKSSWCHWKGLEA